MRYLTASISVTRGYLGSLRGNQNSCNWFSCSSATNSTSLEAESRSKARLYCFASGMGDILEAET